MSSASNALSQKIDAVLSIDPSAPAIEFESHWRTWGDLRTTVDEIAAVVPKPGTPVGILLRSRPVPVGLLLGVLQAGGCVVAINPQRGVERTRTDIAGLELPFIAGEPSDLETHVDASSRSALVAADDLGSPITVDGEVSQDFEVRRDVAVRMLTSGTTGPPKRIDLTYDTLTRVLVGAKHYEAASQTGLSLRSGVAVVNSPLVHLGGLFRILQCVNDGRSFSLLERFSVDGWIDAVRRHRPKTVSLVPTALRMVLEADLDPEDLSSVRSVISGTAPLSPDDADAFSAKYGVPVLVSYAATEFGGGVAGWNLETHRKYWTAKRGSVGRAHASCSLRIVHPDSNEILGPDEVGLLEVKAGQLGSDTSWIRTTDLARIDNDGFLFILGRADQAIIRGGFKVHPDDVRSALERHPRVRGAAVVGVEDPRLGAVPVAVVELRPGPPIDSEELITFISGTLARYELPTRVILVDALPRTPSAKVDLSAIRVLIADSSAPPRQTSSAERNVPA
jgi:acyl-CoA synthetase (AMP-forming)/AMP-acid ligase II